MSLTPPYHNDEQKPESLYQGYRGQRGSDDSFPMSRQLEGGSRSAHNTPQLSPIHSHFPTMESQSRTSPRESHISPPVSLPPLRQLSSTPPTPSSQRLPDPFRAILNPQAELMEQHRDRRRSGSQFESPSPIETQNSQSLPSFSRPTSVNSTQEDHMDPRPFQRPLPRAGLSPRSSRVQRTENLGRPTGTINAQQQPFLTASTRPSEPMTTQSSLPTPPIQNNRVTYFPSAPTTVSMPPNPTHQEVRRTSAGFPMSGSASPSAQYSPFSQPASIESSPYDGSSAPPSYVPNHSNAEMHNSQLSIGPPNSERSMIPMTPSSQHSFQLITIQSQQGHPVQIPVDVQAASRVADEKRKRNAGASARFRARRKEKEREAAENIARLELELAQAREDAQFYREERDYFRAIVLAQPGAERHRDRPISPRLTRMQMQPSRARTSPRGSSVDSYEDYEDDDHVPRRNVRRRISYHPRSGPPPTDMTALVPYHPPSGPPPTDMTALVPYHPRSGPPPTDMTALVPTSHNSSAPAFALAHSTGAQNGGAQNGPNAHVHQLSYREQPASLALQQPHPERPVYRAPLAVDQGRYDNRPWGPGQLPPREN